MPPPRPGTRPFPGSPRSFYSNLESVAFSTKFRPFGCARDNQAALPPIDRLPYADGRY